MRINLRRRINTKLLIEWDKDLREYVARCPAWPVVIGRDRTPEKAALAMAIALEDFVEDLILGDGRL